WIGVRTLLVTASARNLPSLICGPADAMVLKPIGVCPATTDAIEGPAPLNGTCTRSRLSDWQNFSPARCACVPAPGEAKLYLPGLARITSMSSLTAFAGTDGLTVITVVEDTASVTGSKSL